MKTRRFLKSTGIFVLILGMALFSANTVLSKDSVLFGVFGPMTGPAAETGKQIKSGAIMAVEEINAKGGILGKKIELVFGDSESKPSSAVGMMERLITHDKVQLVTGGLHSDIALATMDVTAKYRVPQILNTQVSGEITKKIGNDLEKFKYVFKNGPSPMVYKSGVPGVLDMLDKSGEIKFKKKTVAFFRERSSWGRSLEQAITKGFSDIGWKVVAVETVEHAQSDYLSLLSKVKSIAPDVIVCLQTSTAAASSLAKQFVEKRIPSLLVPIFIPSDPHYIELAGDAANGVLWLVNIATLPNEKGKAFTAAFEKRWGMGPAMTAALQHDLMYMIKAAYEKAGSLDKDKFAEAYLSTNYAGNTGIYTYDPANHQVRAGAEFIPTLAYQIQNKQNIVLWPERYAVGSFITPPWF
jgi:ABC-type branched-subunit amino acid transport system substrate-binding protein